MPEGGKSTLPRGPNLENNSLISSAWVPAGKSLTRITVFDRFFGALKSVVSFIFVLNSPN